MLGNSAYDIPGRHDHLVATGVVPIAPYSSQNANDPKDIEYRVEDRTEEHGENVHLERSLLNETCAIRTGVERATVWRRTAVSGTSTPEAASTHERSFHALCPRVIVAIAVLSGEIYRL